MRVMIEISLIRLMLSGDDSDGGVERVCVTGYWHFFVE
jgi:hypothetical protein